MKYTRSLIWKENQRVSVRIKITHFLNTSRKHSTSCICVPTLVDFLFRLNSWYISFHSVCFIFVYESSSRFILSNNIDDVQPLCLSSDLIATTKWFPNLDLNAKFVKSVLHASLMSRYLSSLRPLLQSTTSLGEHFAFCFLPETLDSKTCSLLIVSSPIATFRTIIVLTS
jgi:hypothetical protein